KKRMKRSVEDDYTYTIAEKKVKLIKDMKKEVFPIIFNHQSYDADIPITLYHQAFAKFQEYCTNIHISIGDCDLVIKLITKMTKAFNCENDRIIEF
ncbi:8897_t:CDS:2, partial [Funneliformis geosporum]